MEQGIICRKCGCLDRPEVRPAKPPHYASALCRHCGHWLKFLPAPPGHAPGHTGKATQNQLAYLAHLGYAGERPETKQAAHLLIQHQLAHIASAQRQVQVLDEELTRLVET